MGLFGKLDVEEVAEDPFAVDNGTYLCTLTKVETRHFDANDNDVIRFSWVISEEDSDFNGNGLQDTLRYYPTLEEDDVTPDIKKDLARLKQRLIQMGVTEEDMDSFDQEATHGDYIGTEAYLTVKNNVDQKDPSKKYRNITFIRLPEEFAGDQDR